MAQHFRRPRIPFSFSFGQKSPLTVAREASVYVSAYGVDDDVPFVQHIEHADQRESVSTAPTSHHPSIVSEVSRFSFSTIASSPDEDCSKAQHVENADDETNRPLLHEQSSHSLFLSDGDVPELSLAESIDLALSSAAKSRVVESSAPSSRVPATNNGVPAFYRTQPAHPLLRSRTKSEPLNRSLDHDTFSNSLPHFSPPPSYTTATHEFDFFEAASPHAPKPDGYFQPYKSTSPEERRPIIPWANSQRIVAPLKHFKLPKFSKLSNLPLSNRNKKTVAIVSPSAATTSAPSQAYQNLHNVRKLLIPYHRSLAVYHAQCIEWYAERAEANIWESQDGRTYRNVSAYRKFPVAHGIWAPQDDSDPIPRWTFWDRARQLRTASHPTSSRSNLHPSLQSQVPPQPTATTHQRSKSPIHSPTYVPSKKDFNPPKHHHNTHKYIHPFDKPSLPQLQVPIQFRTPVFPTPHPNRLTTAQYHTSPTSLSPQTCFFDPSAIHPPKNLPSSTPTQRHDSTTSPTSGTIPIILPPPYDDSIPSSCATTAWRTIRRKRGSANLLAPPEPALVRENGLWKGKGVDRNVHVDYEERGFEGNSFECGGNVGLGGDGTKRGVADKVAENRSFYSPLEYPRAVGYCWMDERRNWERFLRKLEGVREDKGLLGQEEGEEGEWGCWREEDEEDRTEYGDEDEDDERYPLGLEVEPRKW